MPPSAFAEALRDLRAGGGKPSRADLARRIRAAGALAEERREAVLAGACEPRQLAGVTASISRLRRLRSTAELIEHAAREACASCGFTRVMISRVHGRMWMPQRLHLAPQAPANPAFGAFVAGLEIPLANMLVETELVRRRVPKLVLDPAQNAGTFKDLVRVSGSTGYAVAPIMPAGRVIGFLHADRAGAGREVGPQDLQTLWMFAENFGLVFESMVLEQRLEVQRTALLDALTRTAQTVDAVWEEEIALARHDEPPATREAVRRPASSPLGRLLTARELEVLELMAAGATNREIGGSLHISTGTVKTHTTRILRKLRVTTRAEAAARFVQLGDEVAWRSYDFPPVGGRGDAPRHDRVAA